MAETIPALLPRGGGHHFVLYGDSCSGVPGALHEQTFASVNAVVRRLEPPPQFILFPGDEIIGLTHDREALRRQWRHWLDVEMGWLDRTRTPLWHTTGNHTTWDEMSEAVFRDVLDMPRNGPPGQDGLSWYVRRDDLLLVFVNTSWSGLGGEGHVEMEWLDETLAANGDARHRLVIGHHPVFAVNGFSGSYHREIGHEYAEPFWDILVRHDVMAYLCSHILAFDAQLHRGVLQICTAGAGTAHRMPDGVEYLHCVQAALDDDGLRYQVLDVQGQIREQLSWPPAPPADGAWLQLPAGISPACFTGTIAPRAMIQLRIKGYAAPAGHAAAQTLFSAFDGDAIAPIWLGLRGSRQSLTLMTARDPGRSPSYRLGPDIEPGQHFDIHVAFMPDLGPGGVLYRRHDDPRWTSFSATTPVGIETLAWRDIWSVGHGQAGPADRAFAGERLEIWLAQT